MEYDMNLIITLGCFSFVAGVILFLAIRLWDLRAECTAYEQAYIEALREKTQLEIQLRDILAYTKEEKLDQCWKNGCKELETRCKCCGRLVSTANFHKNEVNMESDEDLLNRMIFPKDTYHVSKEDEIRYRNLAINSGGKQEWIPNLIKKEIT